MLQSAPTAEERNGSANPRPFHQTLHNLQQSSIFGISEALCIAIDQMTYFHNSILKCIYLKKYLFICLKSIYIVTSLRNRRFKALLKPGNATAPRNLVCFIKHYKVFNRVLSFISKALCIAIHHMTYFTISF